MASGYAFSPKEWEVWILGETTVGTTVNATTGMYQLDVDSIAMPSLNVTQNLEPRSSPGRTFKTKDFFQDSNLRVVEVSLSGIFHDDTAHKALIENITSEAGADFTVPASYTPEPLQYGVNPGTSAAADYSSFTLVLKAPDQTNAKNIELPGCVVTNYTWSADAGTEGGLLKWSATIQTGSGLCDFADATNSGGTEYVNTDTRKLSSATATEVWNEAVALNSYTLTIDNPAVFAGSNLSAGGYDVINRGAEISVTVDCNVKYDANTDEFISLFDAGAAMVDTDFPFKITSAGLAGVEIMNAVLTNVALSEGDIMMLDVSMKSIAHGSDVLLTLDNA